MPTLNLEADNVAEHELSVAEIRAMDEALTEKVETWLDEAQGPVFTGEREASYLVIKVIK